MIPVHPDDQLVILLEQSSIEMNKYVHALDVQRIIYYTTQVSLVNVSTFKNRGKNSLYDYNRRTFIARKSCLYI